MNDVQLIISHRGCPDGIASAMILAYAFPKAHVRFVNYGEREHDELETIPGMLFCDMTPPQSRAQEFVDVDAVCLDHHKHARNIVEAFGDNGVFDESKCGAELAWDFCNALKLPERQWFNTSVKSFGFARLAGIRDLWKRDDPQWKAACVQAEALRFWGVGLACSPPLPYLTDSQLWAGERLLDQAEERVAEVLEKHQFEVAIIGGLRVAYFPAAGDKVSDICHGILEAGHADVALAYFDVHDGTRIKTVRSLRCRDGIDVGAWAKACGGGGHPKAAGFTLPAAEERDIISAELFDAILSEGG